MLIHEGQRYYEDNQDDILQLLWDEILNQLYGNVGYDNYTFKVDKIIQSDFKKRTMSQSKSVIVPIY